MPERVFQICGATIPPMIGRKAIMERLCSALTKPTPDHLQVIGPRYAGKSVVLHALAQRMQEAGMPYGAVVLWDLGHQTPDSDEAFMSGLRDQLAAGLAKVSPQYADYLRAVEGNPYKELAEVFDELKDQGIKVLMLWDGFDKPLAGGKLSRNLWDQLRELASRPSLRLVIASRKRLYELIRDPESHSSDFWGIFDMSPVRIECFDDNDMKAALSHVSGFTLSTGAQTELINWSGGFPPLLLSVLNDLHELGVTGPVAPDAVNASAEKISDNLTGLVNSLWSDCHQPSKDIFQEALAAHGLDANGLSQADLAQLTEKGFAKRSGSKISTSCRFLEKHVSAHAGDLGLLARLFGSPENFQVNARSLLERRLHHVKTLDPMLRGFIDNSLRWIPDQPAVSIQGVRGIVDRALDLIWTAEFGKDKKIPTDYFSYWKLKDERGPEQYWDEQFPVKRGHQIRLLQLITGTDRSGAKAKCVTKNTYALTNAAHGFGDFGQHIDGVPVDLGTAFATLSVCVELAAVLDRELGNAKMGSE